MEGIINDGDWKEGCTMLIKIERSMMSDSKTRSADGEWSDVRYGSS